MVHTLHTCASFHLSEQRGFCYDTLEVFALSMLLLRYMASALGLGAVFRIFVAFFLMDTALFA